MRKVIFLLLFMLPIFAAAQIESALKMGNSKELSKHLSSEIEFNYLGENLKLSKEDVTTKMTSFFSEYKTKEFRVIHQGSSGLSLQYTIGKLIAENREFKVTYFGKKEGEIIFINQLAIE